MAQLGLPLQRPVNIRYWVPITAQEAQVMRSYSEKAMWQIMERISNVRIEFEHPSVAAAEAFNLLLASGDLPDVIQHNNQWRNVQGGLDGLINDRMILDLTPQINTNMPNLRKVLNDNPVKVDALMRTGEGRYWGLPKIFIDESCWAGPMIREDFLNRFNLQVPQTIDEWENVLRTFRANGIDLPMGFQPNITTIEYGAFIGAYGVVRDFFVGTDNRIHYGPIENGYREFLETFTRWYAEGLIDPEFPALDSTAYRARATGTYGALSSGSVGGVLVAYNTDMARANPNARYIAVPYPRLYRGQNLRFRQQSEAIRPFWAVVSARTRYANEICKMFDYMFSEEGSWLITFGNEGEAWTMGPNGIPAPTPLLTSNPTAVFADIVTRYAGRNSVFLTHPWEVNFMDFTGVQIVARQIWDSSANFDGLRPSYELSAADTQIVNRTMADIRTYEDEMFLRFMMGNESLGNWNAYIQNLRRMGIDDVIARHNANYARFISR
jgi:putative aldouronate transport system substrate-binding protein